ncbi:unnamed protein product [Candidula unifasciata]|uniref:Hemocytin n=1 Tax=Candidula unifasciata TaxID=100452 RepID=A0A8S3YPX7_9EUPU|nr:unnamed protein product [Candidula unifasciata]
MTEEEFSAVCYGGNITDISCVDSETSDDWSSLSEATCTVENGLQCDNIPLPDIPPCRDYKIRYMCQCPDIPPSKIQVNCAWSPWLNADRPESGMGDIERIIDIKTMFGVCSNIINIECRVAGTETLFSQSGENHLACDFLNGFRCYNSEQSDGHCLDYEVRVLCWGDQCSGKPESTKAPQLTTPGLLDTARTTGSCLPGEEWHSCAFTCDEVCDYMGRSSGACKGIPTPEDNCVPGCRRSQAVTNITCKDNEKFIDSRTCVPKAMCTCLRPDGTAAKAFETWENPERECSMCSCFNGEAICSSLDGCSTTLPPPGATTPVPPPLCGWSEWMNENIPSTNSGGDLELLSTLQKLYHICANPTRIMCRDATTLKEAGDSGQNVSCDLEYGLKCFDYQNPGRCYDYEITVYCPCVAHLTSQSPSHSNPTPSYNASSPGCGWTDWMNGQQPSDMGEEESISQLRSQYMFCDTADITAVECRDSSSKKTAEELGQVNVLCDLNYSGLKCFDFDQPDGHCADYEVRFQCEASHCHITSSTSSTVKGHTPPPTAGIDKTPSITVNDNTRPTPSKPDTQTPRPCSSGWSDWINRVSPLNSSGDSETMTAEEKTAFCPDGDLTDIECIDSETGDDWSSLAEATCSLDDGLFCQNLPFEGIQPCRDYKIRYKCKCAAGHTPPPTAGIDKTPSITVNDNTRPTPSKSETQTPRPCSSGWSDWINRVSPLNSSGDSETMTAEEKTAFCPDGDLTDIECIDSETGDDWSSLAEATCSLDDGLFCQNLPFEGIQPCRDYKIRYKCKCADDIQQTEQSQHSQQSLQSQQTQPPKHLQESKVKRSVSDSVLSPPSVSELQIPEECIEEMGLKSGRIQNSMITASTYRDENHGPHQARLGSASSWLAAVSDKHQYIQVDVLVPVYLSGITTQGQHDAASYVTSYKIQHSSDGVKWSPYREHGIDKLFPANRDSQTPVTNMFYKLVRARYLRISPQTWQGRIAMRFEVHGCLQEYARSVVPTFNEKVHTEKHITQKKSPPPLSLDIVDSCVEWDVWVDTYQPSLVNKNDIEPLSHIINASPHCKDPINIECQTATPDHSAAKSTGQKVVCNLWDGLFCNSSLSEEPLCFNYEVRLGCLKQTPECVSGIPRSGGTVRSDIQPSKLCYPEVDASHCPRCAEGYYCDGFKCVLRSECPCKIDNKILRPGGVTRISTCETCQCLAGEVICMPKICPACSLGKAELNSSSCMCQCEQCSSMEFQCATGLCIPRSRRCDGIIDCANDEDGCSSIPLLKIPVGWVKREVANITDNCHSVMCKELKQPVLREGQTAILQRTPDGCCLEYVLCDKSLCPSQPTQCSAPMALQKLETNNTCCVLSQCVCPRECPPVLEPKCSDGYEIVEILQDCNCMTKACGQKMEPLCHYSLTHKHLSGITVSLVVPQTATFKINDTWTDGLCKTCTCLMTSSGSPETSCQTQICSKCQTDEVKVDRQDQCCGECHKIRGCYINGTLYKPGQTIPTNRKCFTRTCEQDSLEKRFIIQETQVTCPPVSTLPTCEPGQDSFDSSECCMKCISQKMVPRSPTGNTAGRSCTTRPVFSHPRDSVGYFQVAMSNGHTCHNTEPVTDLLECSGFCGSSTSLKELMQGYQNTCLSCQVVKMSMHSVKLTCTDGSYLDKTYEVPELCVCNICQDQ